MLTRIVMLTHSAKAIEEKLGDKTGYKTGEHWRREKDKIARWQDDKLMQIPNNIVKFIIWKGARK